MSQFEIVMVAGWITYFLLPLVVATTRGVFAIGGEFLLPVAVMMAAYVVTENQKVIKEWLWIALGAVCLFAEKIYYFVYREEN